MALLKDKINTELSNIDKLISELPDAETLSQHSTLEIAGVATLIHNFYNGIENIIKLILKSENIEIPDSHSWHKELLEKAVYHSILSNELREMLGAYLAFRHFFNHAYALDLYPERLSPLVHNLISTYSLFKRNIQRWI